MTIQEIKCVFSEYVKLKVKQDLPDDYVVTEDDILKGNIFQKYIDNDNVTKIVSGLYIMDNEISYIYPVVKRIEIKSDTEFPPCGGYIDLKVYAYFDVAYVTCTGKKGIVFDNNSCLINSIVKVSNKEFSYSNRKLEKNSPNNTDEELTTNVEAIYYFNGTKFNDTKIIKQNKNKYSSWLVESEPTNFITITLDKDIASRKGDFVGYKVERYFSRIFYMKDSCGNKIGGKSEPNHVEDITKKAIVSSSDVTNFRPDKSGVFVSKQKIGAPERSAVITAKYLNFETKATLPQEEGGKVTYKEELSFDNGATKKFVDLGTSLKTTVNIPIISKKSKYIDGEYNSTVNDVDLKIVSDTIWASGSVKTIEGEVFVTIDILEANTDKENDREVEFLIINREDENYIIKLIVSQSSLNIKSDGYYANFYGFGTYSSTEIDNNYFYFKTFRKIIYEDDSYIIYPVNENLKYKVISKSTDERLLDVSYVEKVDDKYVVNFANYSRNSTMDINVEVYIIFTKEDEGVVFDSEVGKITAKGNEIINYAYELCFDNHEKFESVIWNNEKDTKRINIKSVKYKTVNTFIKETIEVPCIIECINENGDSIYDDNFSIKQEDGKLIIFPYKANNSIVRNYLITQRESNYSIKIRLEYISKNSLLNVPLKIVIKSSDVKEDIWTNKDGYLMVDGRTKINLNPCWLSPSMAEKTDIAYKGNIKLAEGKHNFEISGLKLNTKTTTKDIKYNKAIDVDSKGKEILIEISI